MLIIPCVFVRLSTHSFVLFLCRINYRSWEQKLNKFREKNIGFQFLTKTKHNQKEICVHKWPNFTWQTTNISGWYFFFQFNCHHCHIKISRRFLVGKGYNLHFFSFAILSTYTSSYEKLPKFSSVRVSLSLSLYHLGWLVVATAT